MIKYKDENNLDEDYLKWKSWGKNSFASYSKNEAANFSTEMSRTQILLEKKSKVLDIGFGNGSFLAFAKEKEWDIIGTEINPELVQAARENGFDAVLTDNLSSFLDSSFDLVVAFDVLEHVPQDMLANFIRDVKRILKNGGCFVARFPNGDTPFGLYLQNGDITHVTSIGSGKIQYFSKKFELEIVYIGGEAQPIWGASLLHTAHRIVALPIKKMINFFVNTIIFPKANIAFCSPNMTIVLKKTNSIKGIKVER